MSPLLLLSTAALAQLSGGTLVVNVPNAPGEIMLDGFPTGQTAPARMENVAPGTHLVQLEYGCMVGEKEVTIAVEKTTNLTLSMQYKGGTGTIRLKGVPYTATVLIDDAPVRSWVEGVEVKCGSRRLSVESPGFEDWAESTIITTGKWVTVEVSLVAAEIQESAPAPRPAARYVDEFEEDFDDLDEIDAAYAEDRRGRDYDEYDRLDEPDEPSRSSRDRDRDRELERRRAEQEERRREEESRKEAKRNKEEDGRRQEEQRRRDAEEARRRQAEEERRSRYGDIDSLDDDEESAGEPDDRRYDDELSEPEEDYDELEESRRRSRYDEDFDAEDFDAEDDDRFDVEDDYDELDAPSSGRDRTPRGARDPLDSGGLGGGKTLKLAGTAGLGAVAIGGGVMAIISYSQYRTGRENWEIIVDATGFGSAQEVSYWDLYVEPYRNRVIIGGVLAGVGLAGAGTWFFLAPDGTVHVGYTRRF